MATRRNKAEPPVKMAFWKKDGKLWYADAEDLKAAIRISDRSDDEIKKRMGVGHRHLIDALEGKRIDGWAVAHIEWGIIHESLLSSTKPHSI